VRTYGKEKENGQKESRQEKGEEGQKESRQEKKEEIVFFI